MSEPLDLTIYNESTRGEWWFSTLHETVDPELAGREWYGLLAETPEGNTHVVLDPEINDDNPSDIYVLLNIANKADAQLIVDAPKLLVALERVSELVFNYKKHGLHRGRTDHQNLVEQLTKIVEPLSPIGQPQWEHL